MKLEVLPDAASVARRAARRIAEAAGAAVRARGRFLLALSGGRTPAATFAALAREPLPWREVHVLQVDERVAPAGDADRNLLALREALVERGPLPPANLHAMPVEQPDLDAAARTYAERLRELAGAPPVLDLVLLGLGADGHTASLVPGDPALDVDDSDVALTATYAGRRRMTLTYPALDRARGLLWIVTGEEKAGALSRLVSGDRAIPAGRVRAERATVLADEAAARLAR